MADKVLIVDNAGKKFTRSLKRSMWYGAMDILQNALGIVPNTSVLRKDEFWALEGISFELNRGETIGVIGANGSGKTTLLKLLNGIFMPDKGKIIVWGKVGGLIQVGAGFHPMLTGRENIYVNGAILGMGKKEIDKKLDSIIEFADIGDFLDAPVRHYSSGMYVRLGFAIAIHCEPQILLIDEILAVGDAGFQNKCLNEIGKLRKNGTATILVSHNMHIISTYTERIILLENGKAFYFEDKSEAIQKYSKIFYKQNSEIEKNCNGNNNISFFDVKIPKRNFSSGEDFIIFLSYNAHKDYFDVEIDLTINIGNEPVKFFQATNRAYGKKIDLRHGQHQLFLSIKAIPLNNAVARIGVTIWSEKRHELLFWWSIPVEFKGTAHATGRCFLDTSYEILS